MPKFNTFPLYAAMLVVGALGVALSIFALTREQASTLQAFSAILVAFGTLELALVTLFQTRQFHFYSAQTYQASVRPILVPDGQLSSSDLFSAQHMELHIRHVYGAPATNVSVVVIMQKSGRRDFPSNYYYGELLRPVAISDRLRVDLNFGMVLIAEDDEIEGVSLYAPPKPDSGPMQPLARVTITCADVLGLKHAAIFDYQRSGTWASVATLSGVKSDIHDISAKHAPPSRF